jgi:molybdopterin/thiamine biosynthesis adenylyltransferase
MRVVVAGAGGLGSHVLDMLVRLAPMRVEIWDPGVLDAPDLNRQILYMDADLKERKADAARRRLEKINPAAIIESRAEAVIPGAPLGVLIGGMDACFDCLDSFQSRAALEAALLGSASRFAMGGSPDGVIPVFHGGVSGYFGQAAVLMPPLFGYSRVFGPDFSEIPAGAKGVMPFAAAMVAATQVAQFVHWISRGCTQDEQVRLVAIDCLNNVTETIEIKY